MNEHGGSNFLWENLFWFFGHPEVYIMALPGFGIVMEIMPVFTRKPLFAYKVAAAGMLGVALLSFFVWQHHLFQSGINPDMRPLFMLTTELISIPTGLPLPRHARARSGRRRSGSIPRCSSASGCCSTSSSAA